MRHGAGPPHHPRSNVRSVFVLVALGLGAPGSAASPLAVPRFEIAPSPIGLSGDVRPRQYLGVLGRKAAWLGSETGEAELWVHPLKLANAFHLDFKIPEYDAPVRGADLARRVDVRPELTTITYSHATFTVREHILAPLDEPGLLVLLEVETYRPLDVVVSFHSVFQEAWPGAFGGQYVFWDETMKAFVLSESRRQENAFIGSPWASSGTSHAAHALPDAPSQFLIPIDPERAARELVPIAIVAAKAPRDDVAEMYRSLISRARPLYEARRAHAEHLRHTTTSLESPEPRLDLALEWAKVNLDEQTVCNPDLGCGLVAGFGPSGESLRPGFGWFFGGDAAINSFAMSLVGQGAAVAEGLRFLAKYQRTDGKIPHEISQSAARIAWFTDFPYAYYHADTTPFWLVALWRHWRATGDTALVREIWPAVAKAWAFCVAADTDGDGLMENTAAGLGAIEVGAIGEDIHEDVYLAAVGTKAAEAVAAMARAQGDDALAVEADAMRAKGMRTLDLKYWLEAAGHHAFGLLRSGRTNDTLTVWPATAVALGLLEGPRAQRTLAALSSHRITADWGARMLSRESPLYDPTHYNMGAVWPFVTGFVAWGHYNEGRGYAGYPLVDALARIGLDFARGRHPELLSGAYYRPLDTAVPQQFFATSMLVTPLVAGLLGFEPDAPRGRARLAPALPPQWERAAVRRLPVGATLVDVELRRRPERIEAILRATGPPVDVVFDPRLPLGARHRVPDHPATIRVGDRPVTAVVAFEGGLEVEPPRVDLVPGQSDGGLRVLDARAENDGFVLELEGRAGTVGEVAVRSASPLQAEGARVRDREGRRIRLAVTFPTGEGFTSARVRLRLTP